MQGCASVTVGRGVGGVGSNRDGARKKKRMSSGAKHAPGTAMDGGNGGRRQHERNLRQQVPAPTDPDAWRRRTEKRTPASSATARVCCPTAPSSLVLCCSFLDSTDHHTPHSHTRSWTTFTPQESPPLCSLMSCSLQQRESIECAHALLYTLYAFLCAAALRRLRHPPRLPLLRLLFVTSGLWDAPHRPTWHHRQPMQSTTTSPERCEEGRLRLLLRLRWPASAPCTGA